MKKKIISLLLCVSMIFAFTACGNTEDAGKDMEKGKENEAAGETAESWRPAKNVDLIVPYGAGGGSDILARIYTANMDMGKNIVVQNIEGGGTSVGLYQAYNSEPDGHTITLALPETCIVNYLNASFQDPLHEEMVPICSVVYDASIICVSSKSDFTDMESIIAYSKDHPGELQWASVGATGNNRLGYEQLCLETGIDANFIPFDNASESRTAVLGGNADVLQGAISESLPYISSGDLIPLAVMREDRSTFLPDTPTLKELGYEVMNGLHRAFFCPPETPDHIVAAYEEAFHEAFLLDQTAEAVKEQGAEAEWLGRKELKELIEENAVSIKETFDSLN